MISIVSAYVNRKDLLIKTLDSLQNSEIKDYEFIVVDDVSVDEHRIEDLCEIYPNLKVIRIEPEDKWWVNPCIPFNIGFKECKGDVVIIQNPECKHIGDVMKKASEVTDNEYFSFACYSLDKENTYDKEEFQLLNVGASMDGQLSWYNHSIYRPKGYHFCSAITKKNLDELGGFDSRYAEGIAYDDDELLHRIIKKDIQVKIIDYPFVAHQWHQSINYSHLDAKSLIQKNRNLYINNTLKNK
jgi:glycosyltransferase involved in cell wall biosynthesis